MADGAGTASAASERLEGAAGRSASPGHFPTTSLLASRAKIFALRTSGVAVVQTPCNAMEEFLQRARSKLVSCESEGA